MEEILKTGACRRLLASDLDGTMVGDDKSLRRLNVVLRERRALLLLAYLTGRYKGSVLELLEEEDLIPPDFLICSVGTEIYRAPRYRLDERWRERLRPNWDREVVQRELNRIPKLEPQKYQWEFKQSYYLSDDPEEVVQDITERLTRAGISFKVVYSSGKDLDVIPKAGGKGAALRYIQGQLGLSDSQILVCGDSGNDADMLSLGYCGVVVGNAKPELRETPLPQTVYFARGEFADGILEGLGHFGFLEPVRPL